MASLAYNPPSKRRTQIEKFFVAVTNSSKYSLMFKSILNSPELGKLISRHPDTPIHFIQHQLAINPRQVSHVYPTPIFPTIQIDWGEEGLSANPNVSPEFVMKHIDKPWAFTPLGLLSNYSAITLDLILNVSLERNLIPDGDTSVLYSNPGIYRLSNGILEPTPRNQHHALYRKYFHRFIVEYMRERGEFNIANFRALFSNPGLTPELFHILNGGTETDPENCNLFDRYMWELTMMYSDIRFRDIVFNIGISSNPNLTMSMFYFLKDNHPECICLKRLSSNETPHIMKIVKTYPNYVDTYGNMWVWGKDGLSSNPHMDVPMFVLEDRDIPWYYGEGGLSSCVHITEDYICSNYMEAWCVSALIVNPSPHLSQHFILRMLNEPETIFKGNTSVYNSYHIAPRTHDEPEIKLLKKQKMKSLVESLLTDPNTKFGPEYVFNATPQYPEYEHNPWIGPLTVDPLDMYLHGEIEAHANYRHREEKIGIRYEPYGTRGVMYTSRCTLANMLTQNHKYNLQNVFALGIMSHLVSITLKLSNPHTGENMEEKDAIYTYLMDILMNKR